MISPARSRRKVKINAPKFSCSTSGSQGWATQVASIQVVMGGCSKIVERVFFSCKNVFVFGARMKNANFSLRHESERQGATGMEELS